MATCPKKLARLGVSQLGVSFLQFPWNTGQAQLTLKSGGGTSFPTPVSGESFWVELDGCGCSARFEVTAVVGDVLTVRTPVTTCACVPANTRVRYAHDAPEHVSLLVTEMGVNVVSPLIYDCATRTLSIDCEALKTLVASPCGT